MPQLPKSARRVQEALDAFGVALSVVEFSESTRTAVEAANAIGCTVGQIAKSLLFVGRESGKPALVVASGVNRVNDKALRALLGEKASMADPDFVQARTGYAIGGVPPVGLLEPIDTFIDEDLLQYQAIWAAAGTPHAVFSLTPAQLVEMTRGRVVCVTRDF